MGYKIIMSTRRSFRVKSGAVLVLALTAFCLFSAFLSPLTAQTSSKSEYKPPDMVLVPSGSFNMGTGFITDDEKPIHQVTVSSFYISKHEVTVAEFKAYIDTFYLTVVDFKHNGNVWNGKG